MPAPAAGHARRRWRSWWADPSTGAERGRAVVASRFAVAGGVVTRHQRHDEGLPAAPAAADLRESDEVTARAG